VSLLIFLALLGLATPAWATVTLHFAFGLTREAEACWDAGDRVKYRVAGQTYETSRADVARIEGQCNPAVEPITLVTGGGGAREGSPGSPAEPGPTDAMLAAGRVSLPQPVWSPPFRGGCRARGVEATLRKVIDGDTIEVRMPGGHPEVVRYIGVNTPELHGPGAAEEHGGRAAKAVNERLVAGKRLELAFDVQHRDRHGRLLAYVYADGEHVNALLVEQGYAAATSHAPNVCFSDRFQTLERHARHGRFGLWDEPDRAAALLTAREVNLLAAPAADQPKR
jgi:micrococcal nuclease